MAAPDQLEQTFDAALAEASQTLERIGEDPTLSTAALERYARACADAALLRSRWERQNCPTSTAGSAGQLVVHPFVRAIADAEREAARLGEVLGLTPSSRRAMARRVGHPLGAGQAPDRRAGMVRLVERD